MFKISTVVHLALILSLASTAVIGDLLVQHASLHIQKAIFDNFTHAAIAGISWIIVCFYFRCSDLYVVFSEVLTCTMIGSVIDLDHFLMARSVNLKAATNLKNRPPLHCSTIPAVFFIVSLTASHVLHLQWLQKMGLLVFTAFISHHTRDATRRGFWIYPFGTTNPISKTMYISLICVIPYIICIVKSMLKSNLIITSHSKEFIV